MHMKTVFFVANCFISLDGFKKEGIYCKFNNQQVFCYIIIWHCFLRSTYLCFDEVSVAGSPCLFSIFANYLFPTLILNNLVGKIFSLRRD